MAKYFKRSEFKCPHCGKNEIKDSFINVLDAIRGQYGKPMTVVSGYRCPAHNAAVGGVDKSAHMDGVAADIACSFAGDRLKLVDAALENGIGRIGIGKTFLHFDTSDTLPQEVLWLY
jgi:zinc D-Ala-D-Ala carboxypeptidase